MEAIGLYWIPLKLDMLPFIDKEVDKAIEKFFGILKRSLRKIKDGKQSSI